MPEDEDAPQYRPGGVGIHRPRDAEQPKKRYGEEYKAKVCK